MSLKNFNKNVDPSKNKVVRVDGRKTEIEITDLGVMSLWDIDIVCQNDDGLTLGIRLEPENAKFVAEKILECLKEREEE